MPDPRPPTESLARLALPSAAFVLLTNGYRVVDQYWVDRISVAAQAAVGATMFVLVIAYASYETIAAGAGPLIARTTGAEDPESRRRVLGGALFGALALAAGWMLIGGLFADPLAASLGLEDQARVEAARYLRALSLTGLPLVLTPLMDQAFLGLGDAKTPLRLHGLALAANVVLTPLFVLGLDAGVSGAAYASTLGRAVATAWGLHRLVTRTGLRWSDLRPGPELARVLRIGGPVALNTALYGGVYWVLLGVAVSPLGPEVNAALGIGWSALEGISWPLFHGVSLAAGSIVGRSLGRGDPAEAMRSAKSSLRPTLYLGLAATLLFVGAGELITRPFASDPSVRNLAVGYALIVGASQVFVAIESTAEGILVGAGDTRAVFWASAPWNLARIPLAWALALPLGMGADGIWWVMTLTTVGKAAMKWGRVRSGRWTSSLDEGSTVEGKT